MKWYRTILLTAAALIFASGCAKEASTIYEAEKDLFEARKRAGELTFPVLNREFLQETLDAYRDIVEKYGGRTEKVEGMDRLMLTVLMELAQLELRASMFDAAREDFLSAYEIAGDVPEAEANALWSAAFVSRESGDLEEARRLFTLFYEKHLVSGRILETASMNRRYLLTPIRLAEMCGDTAGGECSKLWLERAEKVYREILRSQADPDLMKEARYNLVTTYLLGERWSRARKEIAELKERYGGGTEMPGLLYLDAEVALDGFDDEKGAISILGRIVNEYPQSREAPVALLMTGNIHLAANEFDRAAEAYSRIIEDYREAGSEAVEAMWQLAILEERRGNWVEASLHYKSIYTNFPATIQGMEAPLRITAHYRETGDSEALAAAYDRAIEHYDRLSSKQYDETIRIIAEEYHVRTLIEQERWEDAASLLLALPGRYPQYHRFKSNLLAAASIYETQLNDPDRAARILRRCISQYGDTPLAAEARKQLDRIEGKG